MDLTAAAYQATEGGPLDVDRDFYRAIANDKGRARRIPRAAN